MSRMRCLRSFCKQRRSTLSTPGGNSGLTDTASGGELPAAEFAAWSFRRNRVNRFFTRMGYANINVNQKTFCEDAYGREQQFRNYRGENRNMLTTDATARLLTDQLLAGILWTLLLGYVLYAAALWLERRLLRWRTLGDLA